MAIPESGGLLELIEGTERLPISKVNLRLLSFLSPCAENPFEFPVHSLIWGKKLIGGQFGKLLALLRTLPDAKQGWCTNARLRLQQPDQLNQ